MFAVPLMMMSPTCALLYDAETPVPIPAPVLLVAVIVPLEIMTLPAVPYLPAPMPAPSSVETTGEMIQRIRSFLDDLKKTPYDNVLIACHGGIMRVLSGCLEGRPRGYIWRPKPHNCEIRMYEI